MSSRLFEGKSHASVYQKYRFSAPQEVQDIIFNYMGERLTKPYGLAVDVGCGTGQSTRILVPYFQKIVGTDISQAQIEEARNADHFPNVTYSVSPAEELPVDDASVDLITACAAVHWFDTEKFLKEVDRILKPRGCLAFYTYLPDMELHYKDRSEQLTKVVREVHDTLAPYVSERVNHVKSGYKDIFEAIPYADKQRMEKITVKIPMPLADFIGLIQTFSMYQIYLKLEPEKAKDLIVTTEKRLLEIMGVSSTETKIDALMTNVCLLASKPV
ncbi:putative methyltransferase DDB_G0268948 [Spea bombifrons]|uniref:putative methyltransferase DDB_G0268948 n=1 Tax=Spea bombifrons TaxID=233779 RepID=UPI002349EC12|nr:putative methyltransferase DDB_G0268948 [Spea bombifrons]XP_053327781.1 putative methyltransferase DDB_G0268948 [Spea bombifrons]XP_053327782.1 putative methyltransferase DDB_G0268948 [Spea bombifrons]XP_053327783.1 putative methyltransferase DDB_G0268948 [Spea bombifrons]XP_053327784.1 putative methyltransferase DDB_G0268948 [Spea bombifrons]